MRPAGPTPRFAWGNAMRDAGRTASRQEPRAKPPISQLQALYLGAASHPQATYVRPSCDPHATLKPPSCDPRAREKPRLSVDVGNSPTSGNLVRAKSLDSGPFPIQDGRKSPKPRVPDDAIEDTACLSGSSTNLLEPDPCVVVSGPQGILAAIGA